MSDLKTHTRERIEHGLKHYLNDLNAMDEQMICSSIGGNARKPVDFTYEVAFVNRRIAKRLKGETVEPWPDQGWICAPADANSKAAAIQHLTDSTNEVLTAWDALDSDELNKEIVISEESKTTPLEIASMCATHMMYHDAQLNYVQSFAGDEAVHWD